MRHRASQDSAGPQLPHNAGKNLDARLAAAREEQRATRARLEEVDALIEAMTERRDALLAVLAAAEVTEKSCGERTASLEVRLPPMPEEDAPYQIKTEEFLEVTPTPAASPVPRRAAPPPPPVEAPAPRKAAPPPPPVEAAAPPKAAARAPTAASGLSLQVKQDGGEVEVHALRDEPFLIGRGPKSHMVLKVAGVSRTHARILRNAEGTYVISDLSSGGGVAVNGRPCKEAPLAAGDRIIIADVEIRVCAGGATGRR